MQLTDSFCAEVAAADPLGADGLLATLPEVNERADLGRLGDILAQLTETAGRVGLESTSDRLAAVRDIGMTLGSFKRYGVEPLTVVPGAEQLLLRLGAQTAMVPRDTVLHYGAWNPRGPRQRMYTGAAEEDVLIHSVRAGAMAIERSALGLAELAHLDPAGAEYLAVLQRAAEDFAVLPAQIGLVAEKVPPAEFFMLRLRPYMEDVLVNGRSYYGPAAAHVPLYLIDHLLWSSDRVDPEHVALHQELMDYGLPEWIRLYRKRQGSESVVTQVVRALLAARREASAELLAAGRAVGELLRALVVFRGRHLRLVRDSYTVDSPYTAGSAGAAPEVVKLVLDLTRACERQLAGSLSSADGPRP
ncbi:monodechloroaminopyrrolnitrin synthase PrnB family protein [Kitasatospora sp. NPDC006697]|uniref:monodechloroaminopyrrolnitrin synthase PrnB family protein n=1 Tax=Kitasatospora sp. NPDC006697 TaxID=3364020 RepID=UPI0036CFB0CE